MLGLDIGTYSIKAVELEKRNDTLTLINFKIKERPLEGQEPLSAILKKFFEEGNFRSKELSLSISGHLVIVRLAELPEMSEEELKNAIRFEAEKYIPFNIEDAIVDYKVISRNPNLKKLTVLFAAAKGDFIKNYIDAITSFGFVVTGVDVDGVALTNTFLTAHPAKDQEVMDEGVALLNIGDAFLNMVVVYQALPVVLRDIDNSGREFAEEIAEGLGLNIKEAYQFKHSPPLDKQELLFEMLRPSLDKLAKEIRLSFGYFENQFAKSIGRVYLSGGSSRVFGLKEFLSESLEVQIETWDPLNSIKLGQNISIKSLEESKQELAVALGLALRDD